MKSKLLIMTMYASLYVSNYCVAAQENQGIRSLRGQRSVTFATTTSAGVKLILFSDGTRSTEFPSGDKNIMFPDGLSITHQADGIELTTIPDLGCELKYPSGHLAFKYLSGLILYVDSDGNNIDGSELPDEEILMKKK